MKQFLLFFDDDGKPAINGPFATEEERDLVARTHYLRNGGDVSDYYRLTVHDNTPVIVGYNDAELVLGDTSMFTDQGLLLDDGCVLHWPEEETGVILKSDGEGDIVGEFWPGEPEYQEILEKFPPNGDLEFGDEPDDQPVFELVFPGEPTNE